MAIFRAITPAALLVAVLILTGCPDPEASLPRVDEAAERQAIEEVLDRARENVTAQNWDALSEDLTDDFIQYSDGQSATFNEFRDLFERHITEHESTFFDYDIRVSGDGRMAWATFSETTTFQFDGQPAEDEALFTAVLEKRNDRWLIAHIHRSVSRPMPEAQPGP